MELPNVFDIQKYCIHDGDGIRTTVFFKGCPLKCTWCHNPESQRYGNELFFHSEKCAGCSACEQSCPHHAVHMLDGQAVTSREECQVCGQCLDYCVKDARRITGRAYPMNELIKEIEKDKMFYEESSGGVTLSGGEVMAQNMDYIEELVRKLHRKGYDIAIDTSGYTSYNNFERILPYVSTFLYDIKHMDSDKHREITGFGNELILENLQQLSQAGARIYVRIPLIEGINAEEDEVDQVIKYLREHVNAVQVNLLPYHNTGMHKYEKLSRSYEGQQMAAPSQEKMELYMKKFQNNGFPNTKIGG